MENGPQSRTLTGEAGSTTGNARSEKRLKVTHFCQAGLHCYECALRPFSTDWTFTVADSREGGARGNGTGGGASQVGHLGLVWWTKEMNGKEGGGLLFW